jgi:hypothetical protein
MQDRQASFVSRDAELPEFSRKFCAARGSMTGRPGERNHVKFPLFMGIQFCVI